MTTVGFARRETKTREGQTAPVLVQLDEPAASRVRVPFRLGGLATSADYRIFTDQSGAFEELDSRELYFAPGQTVQRLEFRITFDEITEPREGAWMILGRPAGPCRLGAINRHRVLIAANDAVAQPLPAVPAQPNPGPGAPPAAGNSLTPYGRRRECGASGYKATGFRGAANYKIIDARARGTKAAAWGLRQIDQSNSYVAGDHVFILLPAGPQDPFSINKDGWQYESAFIEKDVVPHLVGPKSEKGEGKETWVALPSDQITPKSGDTIHLEGARANYRGQLWMHDIAIQAGGRSAVHTHNRHNTPGQPDNNVTLSSLILDRCWVGTIDDPWSAGIKMQAPEEGYHYAEWILQVYACHVSLIDCDFNGRFCVEHHLYNHEGPSDEAFGPYYFINNDFEYCGGNILYFTNRDNNNSLTWEQENNYGGPYKGHRSVIVRGLRGHGFGAGARKDAYALTLNPAPIDAGAC